MSGSESLKAIGERIDAKLARLEAEEAEIKAAAQKPDEFSAGAEPKSGTGEASGPALPSADTDALWGR